MAHPIESRRVIVLRKTKLGESDLILRCLGQDGSLVEAVAKGARKPTSSFASRLELYSCADVLLAQGRGLAIVKEARLVEGNAALRSSFERSVAAAPAAELLTRVAQPDLEHPRLFDLTCAAFERMARAEGPAVLALVAAHLVKAMAMVGFQPSFSACSRCGAPVDLDAAPSCVPFSFLEGGVVCPSCRGRVETTVQATETLRWVRYLLSARLDEVAGVGIGAGAAAGALRFDQAWIKVHADCRLKSLEFLFASGLQAVSGEALV